MICLPLFVHSIAVYIAAARQAELGQRFGETQSAISICSVYVRMTHCSQPQNMLLTRAIIQVG